MYYISSGNIGFLIRIEHRLLLEKLIFSGGGGGGGGAGRGYPTRGPGGEGVPHPRSGWEVPWGTPCLGLDGVHPPPIQDWMG